MNVPNLFALASGIFNSRPEDVAALRQVCDETDALRAAVGPDDPRVQAGEVRANNLKGLFTRRIAWACYQQDPRFGLRLKTIGQMATRPLDGKTHSTDALMMRDTGQIIDAMSDRDVTWGVTEGDTQPLDQWLAPLPEGDAGDGQVPSPLPSPSPETPTVDSAPALERLAAIEAQLVAMKAQLQTLRDQAPGSATLPPIVFPIYEGHTAFGTIVLKPRT